jgi:NET1-associated nuclear protein 1 (U3 small nucleolar RNA-associated protein 17)
VYSAASSLLVRRLESKVLIVQAQLSKVDSEIVYIATQDSCIETWNWTSGQKLASLPLGSAIYWFEVMAKDDETEQVFLVLENSNEADRQFSIACFDVPTHEEHFAPDVKHLFSDPKPLQFLSVVGERRTIFAASATRVFVGVSDGKGSAYKWNTFLFRDQPSSLDVRVEERKGRKIYRLAIGSREGPIILYDDILGLLGQDGELTGSKLHWHREVVRSVKWSRDGNYLISGGNETTLCLWQLETGRKQFLPHLGAAIQGITVSPSGTSYGLRLSDNSVMVLSTSELSPTTMIAGLQSRLFHEFPSVYSHAASLASRYSLATPAVEHKLSPGRLLVAVPASQNDDGVKFYKPPPLPFLQTYDISLNRHISRLALARNNVTNVKSVGGAKMQDANVTLMKISCDGHWLATVEQWTPPSSDVEYLVHDHFSKADEQKKRREVFLKFWSWVATEDSWRLECRIDAPHQSDAVESENQTLDLASDPARLGFATIGEDGIVRVWRPKTRLPDGRVLHGARAGGLTTWACAQMLDLGRTSAPDIVSDHASIGPAAERARLAFSQDGSVLAAAQDGGEAGTGAGLVHFVAARTGEARGAQALAYTGALAGMLFVGARRLAVLSDRALHVWDAVASELAFSFVLPAVDLPKPLVPALSHLSASVSGEQHLLVAVPATGPAARWPGAAVFVFPLEGGGEPCFSAESAAPVSAVVPLSAAAGGGFALIDVAGELRVVRPRGAAAVDPVRLAAVLEEEEHAVVAEAEGAAVDVVMGEPEEAGDGAEDSDASDDDAEDDGRPVVGAEKLAAVFDGAPAFALPPVHELFEAVARLYVGRRREGRSDK